MDNRKIYSYHNLSLVDVFDSIDWARENFEHYDGETSPLWNEHVQQEFARLNAERNAYRSGLAKTLSYIAADMELQQEIDTIS